MPNNGHHLLVENIEKDIYLSQTHHECLWFRRLSCLVSQFIYQNQLIAVPFITSPEYNYQNTLRFFHFYAKIELPKQMERQLLRLTLQIRFWKAFWWLHSADVQGKPVIWSHSGDPTIELWVAVTLLEWFKFSKTDHRESRVLIWNTHYR